VSLLALAQPAEARIIYTKANVEIAPGRDKVGLDLNHDRSIDFRFAHHSGKTQSSLNISPLGHNGVESGAAALGSGVSVGSDGQFQGGKQPMARIFFSCSPGNGGSSTTCTFQSSGPWKNITNRYLGLKFFIDGKAHYGWARLNVTVSNRGVYGLLTGYAYETIANKTIVTGKTKGEEDEIGISPADLSSHSADAEPGTLGQLAQGATGQANRRKWDALAK
jgi:hypothetical protein